MAELDDKDLRGMFQRTGRLRPTSDLAGRIMAQVAVTPIMRRTEVRPLIGRWWWVTIAMGSMIAVAAVVLDGGTPTGQAVPYNEVLQRAGEFIELNGPWPIWLAGTAACALLLVVMDRLLASRIGDRSIG